MPSHREGGAAVAQRLRAERGIDAKYAIDVSPEHYAYVARMREEETRGTLKDTLGAIIKAHRGGA
jgi:hypothetical protein